MSTLWFVEWSSSWWLSWTIVFLGYCNRHRIGHSIMETALKTTKRMTVNHNEIGYGTKKEVELRACSIYAVEEMRDLIQKLTRKQVLSVELDIWLWAYGISNPSLQISLIVEL
ncbi:queuosine salvage protein-like protein [Tanacetum coccineum]